MYQQQEEKEITEDPGEQQDQTFESSSKKPREEYAYLKVPYDILNSPRPVQMADRPKISDRAAVGLLAATLKSFKTDDDGDVNLNDFTLSRTTARRKMAEFCQSNAEAASGKFGSNVPERLILHWDGKKITNMDGDLYEALVVLVSGEPDYTEGKLLGNYYLY